MKIFIKELEIPIEVSKATFYRIVKKEVGRFLEQFVYEVSLDTIKKYPKLYNRLRREI